MDISCNGRFIITCSKINDLIIWDLKGEPLAIVDTYLGSTHQAKISPCGRFVAASGSNNNFKYKIKKKKIMNLIFVCCFQLLFLGFTPDVKIWEVGFTKTGEYKQVGKAFNLAGHSSGIYDFDFCADSSLMASVSKDGTFRFYDTKSELALFIHHMYILYVVLDYLNDDLTFIKNTFL